MRRSFGVLGAALAIVLGGGANTTARRVGTPVTAAPANPGQEVFYQIFTRSMRDSNGDGDGDLQGITDSLDYLKRLGVASILLTPLYPSEFYHNYSADDFEGIDPDFGTLADYRQIGRASCRERECQYV